MKKVAVVFNGGTISMKIDEKLKAAVPNLSGDQIMSMVTGIESYAEIETYTFSSLPSPHVTPTMMMELSKMIQKLLDRDDIVGVVTTHGTDTLEETAYFLDLTLNSQKPVIVTGSMRNSSELGYDGPANLAASICTATSQKSMGRGVLVCLNNEINCASEVTKEHSMSLNTFKSPEFGPVGIVDSNEPIYYRNNLNKQKILTDKFEKNVDLIKACAGMDGKFIDFAVMEGAKGLVVEGTGRGNLPPLMAKSVAKAINRGVIVILVTRCYKGRVLDSYGYEGGGKDLRKAGIIFGDRLPGQKARIKLMLALGKTENKDEIKEIFENGLYI